MILSDFVRITLRARIPTICIALFVIVGLDPIVVCAQSAVQPFVEQSSQGIDYSIVPHPDVTLLAPTTPELEIPLPAETRITPNEYQEDALNRATSDYNAYLPYRRIQAQVSMPHLSVQIGDKFDLEIAMQANEELAEFADRFGSISFVVKVRFNASMLAVLDETNRGQIVNGMHYAHSTSKISAKDLLTSESLTLARIPVQAALGTSAESSIELVQLYVIASNGGHQPLDVKSTPGTLKIQDNYNGRRRINEADYTSVNISPNPLLVESTISVENLNGADGDLQIYNLRGQLVRRYELSSGLQANRFDVRIARRDLTAGPYFCRLTIGARTIVRTMIVE